MKYIPKINQKKRFITLIIISQILTPITVYASVEATWNVAIEALFPWVIKLGIVLLVFGAIEFAIAQQGEDAAQKTRSGRFMISGAACIAVAYTLKPFLLF